MNVVHPDLPRTDHLTPPATGLLRGFRRLGSAVLHQWWDLSVAGTEHVPASGPVILAANHLGVVDGPLLVTVTRRTTLALAKSELFTGVVGSFLEAAGQIPIARHYVDTTAIRRGVRVLRDGHALAIFPEGLRGRGDASQIRDGVAYLAMITGAPIVPVAILGTRNAGMSVKAVPGHRARVHLEYGQPIRLPRYAWPRRRDQVARHAEQVRRHLAGHIAAVEARTGVRLPMTETVLVPAA